jgi:hypothetical protein
MSYSQVIGYMTAYKRCVLTLHRGNDEFAETTVVPFGAGGNDAQKDHNRSNSIMTFDSGNDSDPLWRTVTVRRNTTGGFGLDLQYDERQIGTRIKRVNASDYDGLLVAGDVVVGINGEPVINTPHEILVTMLVSSL